MQTKATAVARSSFACVSMCRVDVDPIHWNTPHARTHTHTHTHPHTHTHTHTHTHVSAPTTTLSSQQKSHHCHGAHHVQAMWKLLWPRSPFAKGPDGEGSLEITGIAVLMLFRIYLMNLVSYYVG
jgi:hypothetical protein